MGRAMTPVKRALDLTIAILLLAVLWPVIVIFVFLLWSVEGRPVFYVSERMRTPDRAFGLVKFRTMRPRADADGGVTGGNKAAMMSRWHRIMRRTRADELPQLWNVLKGDISLVGPRPPLRRYVSAFPALYAQVLRNRPGMTGLATLRFHRHEEWILAACQTPEQTEAAYRRRCIPRKARLDLIYQRNRSLWLDLRLIGETAGAPFGLRRRSGRRNKDQATKPGETGGNQPKV